MHVIIGNSIATPCTDKWSVRTNAIIDNTTGFPIPPGKTIKDATPGKMPLFAIGGSKLSLLPAMQHVYTSGLDAVFLKQCYKNRKDQGQLCALTMEMLLAINNYAFDNYQIKYYACTA